MCGGAAGKKGSELEVERHLGGVWTGPGHPSAAACHYDEGPAKSQKIIMETQRSLGLNCKRSDTLYRRYLE